MLCDPLPPSSPCSETPVEAPHGPQASAGIPHLWLFSSPGSPAWPLKPGDIFLVSLSVPCDDVAHRKCGLFNIEVKERVNFEPGMTTGQKDSFTEVSGLQ